MKVIEYGTGRFSQKIDQRAKMEIGLIGAGCYGTALAQSFCQHDIDVVLISNEKKIADEINMQHTHVKALPGVSLCRKIRCSTQYGDLADVDVIFVTVPAAAAVSVCIEASKLHKPIVLCSKGLDPSTGELLSSALEASVDNELFIWSGPSFAIEVATGHCTEVNLAGKNTQLSAELAEKISSDQLVVTSISDYIGLQVVGVFKNVLAVACGMLRKSGCNETAKFVTQGIQEMVKLVEKMRGDRNIFFEVGGIGDIFLTCTSEKSRNVLFGEFCAENSSKNWNGPLAEGALTLKWIPIFEKRHEISLPFFHSIYEIVYENANISRFMK